MKLVGLPTGILPFKIFQIRGRSVAYTYVVYTPARYVRNVKRESVGSATSARGVKVVKPKFHYADFSEIVEFGLKMCCTVLYSDKLSL